MERKLLAYWVVIGIVVTMGICSNVFGESASVLLEKGIYTEETTGDLDAAIKIYRQIIEDQQAAREQVAQAYYRLGMCYVKQDKIESARRMLGSLIKLYPEQTELVAQAQPVLNRISRPNPAALMPPETLVYLELGSPGRQVEKILNMLKGTPLANPLAVIGGGQGKGLGQKGPGAVLAALLNPSMVEEFKKIRGMAIGITEIRQGQQHFVAALYPGESDALRGMLTAGILMAGQPTEAIEGMQTVQMGSGESAVGCAFDNNVMIITAPFERLVWSVKQYKGITNQPSLASANSAFTKLGREAREQNTLTIWANVARAFEGIKKMSGGGQGILGLIEGIADVKNIETLMARVVIEERGLFVEATLDFKDGHQCLLYNLISTPNLSRTGFAAVPPNAIAVASVALNEPQDSSAGAAGAQEAVRRLIGLDIGRELFSNIEQLTLFALPLDLKGGQTTLAPSLGLAITSRDPQQTRMLLGQILGVAGLATMGDASAEQKSQEQTDDAAGKYLVKIFGEKTLYFYLGQAGKSTVLALSPEVLKASLDALEQNQSAMTAGPLQRQLSKMDPNVSKLFLVTAGSAVGPVYGYLKHSRRSGKAAWSKWAVETDMMKRHAKWRSTSWARPLNTKNASLDVRGQYIRFTVNQPNRRHIWEKRLGMPVNCQKYPIAVLKYRADNIANSDKFAIWLDAAKGPGGGSRSVFSNNELIADGQVHELRKDLRKLNLVGPVKGMLLGVHCDDAPPAVFDLLGLKFESPGDAIDKPLPEEQVIAVAGGSKWQSTDRAGLHTDDVSLETRPDFLRFTVDDAEKRHVWINPLDVPIDFRRYPIVVMKYRAQHAAKSQRYAIWMDDGTGPGSGGLPVFRAEDLIDDGQVHELRKDLRKDVRKDSYVFHPQGPITNIALAVQCGDDAPAVFDLLAFDFEPAPGEPADVPETQPAGVAETQPKAISQLAQIFANTTIEAYTIETPNRLEVRIGLNDLPPLGDAFTPLMELQQSKIKAHLKAGISMTE